MLDTPRPRLLPVCLAVVAVLAGCATPSASQDASPSPTVDAAAVNDTMAAVADARRVAAEQVDAELRAAVRVEPMVAALRAPSTVDPTLEEVPAVVGLFQRADLAAGDGVLDRLDAALGTATSAIEATAAEVEPGSWQARFLSAQGDVLTALAEWNAASRAVHDELSSHWDLWQGLVDEAAVLDEDRWRYRTEEEAAGTWQIEVDDRLDRLAAATAAIAPVTEVRDAAAAAVTAADQRAAEVFADRPTAPPSPTAAP